MSGWKQALFGWLNDPAPPVVGGTDTIEHLGDLYYVGPEAPIPGPPPTDIVAKNDFDGVSAPRWTRHYTARLDHRCVIKITAKDAWFSRDRDFTGELTQPNGRWIFFDPERIADKILDPVLVPLIEKACDEIMEMDRVFFAKGKPDRFKDDKGQVWVRA